MTQLELSKKEVEHLKNQQKLTVDLLNDLKREVGMIGEERIAEHLAMITGSRFNPKDFDMRDRNGEQ